MHLVVEVIEFFSQFTGLHLEMCFEIIARLSGECDSSCQRICKCSRFSTFDEAQRFNSPLIAVNKTKLSQFVVWRHAVSKKCRAKLLARDWRAQLLCQLNCLFEFCFG